LTNHFLVAYTCRYYVILEYLHFTKKGICFFKTCLRIVWGHNVVKGASCLYTTQFLWQLNQKAGCYIIDQGCRNYGTPAQNGTQNDFLGTQQSLLDIYRWGAGLAIIGRIRDIGQNVSRSSFVTGSSSSPTYCHMFFLIAFLAEAFIRNIK